MNYEKFIVIDNNRSLEECRRQALIALANYNDMPWQFLDTNYDNGRFQKFSFVTFSIAVDCKYYEFEKIKRKKRLFDFEQGTYVGKEVEAVVKKAVPTYSKKEYSFLLDVNDHKFYPLSYLTCNDFRPFGDNAYYKNLYYKNRLPNIITALYKTEIENKVYTDMKVDNTEYLIKAVADYCREKVVENIKNGIETNGDNLNIMTNVLCSKICGYMATCFVMPWRDNFIYSFEDGSGKVFNCMASRPMCSEKVFHYDPEALDEKLGILVVILWVVTSLYFVIGLGFGLLSSLIMATALVCLVCVLIYIFYIIIGKLIIKISQKNLMAKNQKELKKTLKKNGYSKLTSNDTKRINWIY